MNALHNWLCQSSFWRIGLQQRILPWALSGVDLGSAVLEVGPGYGMATDVLRQTSPRVTTVEIDRRLAALLASRLSATNVNVIQGDGTALPFPDEVFSGAVCFTMLHHVPSAALQDRLLAEVRRVLRPGGVFAGTDSLWSRGMQWIHYRDTLVAIDPGTFPSRLEQAGFTAVDIQQHGQVFRFRAHRQ
ncbi:MAG TPA: class I SAM-dependent methyltransferase [Bryobacteraceae bacterium]|jgi:SAM-dependent methyltransferase